MAQKNLKDRLAEKEEALQKAEEKKNFYAKRVAKLKDEVKNLKTELLWHFFRNVIWIWMTWNCLQMKLNHLKRRLKRLQNLLPHTRR